MIYEVSEKSKLTFIFIALIIILFSSLGCRSGNVNIKNSVHDNSRFNRENPPVTVRQNIGSIDINCRGTKRSMQDCIDVANKTCPYGWIVYVFKNDDTGTLMAIRNSQTETKNTSFAVGGGGQFTRYMIVECKSKKPDVN